MFIEQLKIEFKVYLRQPLYLVFSILMPLISFAIFGNIYGGLTYGNNDFFSQYIPSFCVLILFASSVYNVGNQLVGDKEKGIYRRLMVTPVKLWKIIVVLVLKSAIVAMISYFLVMILAKTQFKVKIPNFFIFTVMYFVTVLYSLVLGVGLGIIINRLNTYSGVLMVSFIPLFVLSDAMMPITMFPNWMQTLAEYNPLYRLNVFLRSFWNLSSIHSTKNLIMSCIYLALFMTVFLFIVAIRWRQGKLFSEQ